MLDMLLIAEIKGNQLIGIKAKELSQCQQKGVSS